MKQKNGWIKYVAVSFAGSLWGTNGLFVKELAATGSNAYLTSFFRFFFAFFIMAIIVLAKYGIEAFILEKRTLLSCALLGLFCHAAYNVFYSMSVNYSGITIAAVLVNTAPIYTMLTSRIVYKEKLTPVKIAAILLNITGCILCATNGVFDIKSISLLGVLWGIGAALVYSMSAIFGSMAKKGTNPFVMCTYCYLFGWMFLFFFIKPWEGFHWNASMVLWGVGYAIIPTCCSYVFYYWGLQKITECSKVPVLTSVETIVAAVFDILVFKEILGIWSYIGVAFVLISIAMMNLKLRRKSKEVSFV